MLKILKKREISQILKIQNKTYQENKNSLILKLIKNYN
jgi:hypothetical protein